MVKRLILIALLATVTACAPSNWWSEESPPPAVLEQSLTGSGCGPVKDILYGSETISRSTYQCWLERVSGLWTDVHGSERDSLNDYEVEMLLDRGVLELPGDNQENLTKVLAVKRLLGFGRSINKKGVDRWMDWLGDHRSKFRSLMTREKTNYATLVNAVDVLSSLLDEMSITVTPEELGSLVLPFIPRRNAPLRGAIIEASRVAFNLVAFVCPNVEDESLINSNQVAQCLRELEAHFHPGAVWFDFVLTADYKVEHKRQIESAVDLVALLVERWFTVSQGKVVKTGLWVELAQKLGMEVTKDDAKRLAWIRKFDTLSSHEVLSPTLMVLAFEVIQEYQKLVLDGYELFEQCEGLDIEKQSTCLSGLLESARKDHPSIDLALNIRNLKYARKLLPLNASLFKKIMFFYAASKTIVRVFDHDGNGLITVGSSEADPGEFFPLISMAFDYIENKDFIENVRLRLDGQELPKKPYRIHETLNPIGMAQLATMMGDTLTGRTEDERLAIADLFDNVTNVAPSSALHVDRLALTGILTVVDTLGTIRSGYFNPDLMDVQIGQTPKIYVDVDGHRYMKEEEALNAVPGILKAHYPRIYNSCVEYDYERSCEILFRELLPGGHPKLLPSGETVDNLIGIGNFDILTLAATYTESLLDICDGDGNEMLSWNILDGSDELDCAITRLKDTAIRVMNTNLVSRENGTVRLLKIVNSLVFTRMFGKHALIRGSRKNLILRLPTFLFTQNATIGSMYALAAEVLAEEEVVALKEERERVKKENRERRKAEKRAQRRERNRTRE